MSQPKSALEITGPDGWEQAEGLEGALVAWVVPARDDGGFRANVVVVAADAAESIDEVRAGHGDALLDGLIDARLLDVAAARVAGRDASYALAAAVAGDNEDVTVEQWLVLADDRALAITATVPTPDYLETVGDVRALIDSVEITDA